MQEFYTSTLENKFIKNLLKSTPLPIYPIVYKGDFVVLGRKYFYNGKVIKSTSSEKLNDNYIVVSDIDDVSTFVPYNSRNDYYDTETHERLGEYLRYYRSMTGINLSPFYNCFSDRHIDYFRFNKIIDNKGKSDMLTYGNIGIDITAKEFFEKMPDSTVDVDIIGYDSMSGFCVYDSYEDAIKNSVSGDIVIYPSNNRQHMIISLIGEPTTPPLAVQYGLVTQTNFSTNEKYSISEGVIFPINVEIKSLSYTVKGSVIQDVPTRVRFKYAEENDKSSEVIMVPIKFDTVYTIALDCSSQVIMRPFIYNERIDDEKSAMITNYICDYSAEKVMNNTSVENTDDFQSNCNPIVLNRMTFSKPLLFQTKLDDSNIPYSHKDILKINEKYLYLFIQLPKGLKTSVCVIEGIHNNKQNQNIINFENCDGNLMKNLIDRNKKDADNHMGYFNFMNSNFGTVRGRYEKEVTIVSALNSIDSDRADEFMITNLSLLRLNTKRSYAFSDRLVEYLLNNVITHSDDSSGNIIEVNTCLGLSNDKDRTMVEWSDRTRYLAYEFMHNIEIEDVNGFIDKDTEHYIERG